VRDVERQGGDLRPPAAARRGRDVPGAPRQLRARPGDLAGPLQHEPGRPRARARRHGQGAVEAQDRAQIKPVPRDMFSIKALARTLALVVLTGGWAALRLQMNGEYKNASWAAIAEFSAPLPFG